MQDLISDSFIQIVRTGTHCGETELPSFEPCLSLRVDDDRDAVNANEGLCENMSAYHQTRREAEQ
jgi:hypothetical protein